MLYVTRLRCIEYMYALMGMIYKRQQHKAFSHIFILIFIIYFYNFILIFTQLCALKREMNSMLPLFLSLGFLVAMCGPQNSILHEQKMVLKQLETTYVPKLMQR